MRLALLRAIIIGLIGKHETGGTYLMSGARLSSDKEDRVLRVGQAWWWAALSLVLAVVVVAIVNRVIGINDGVTVVTILLLPLLVYGVVSGKLIEFTGPGGLGAKFAQTASKTIGASKLASNGSVNVEQAKDWLLSDTLSKASADTMDSEILESLQKSGGPSTLTMELGSTGFDAVTLASVIEKLYKLPNFRFVVIVDNDGDLVAYAPPDAIIRNTLIRSVIDPDRVRNKESGIEKAQGPSGPETAADQVLQGQSDPDVDLNGKRYYYDTETIREIIRQDATDDLQNLIMAVEERRTADIKAIPRMNTKTLRDDSTNADALKKLDNLNQEAIVMVDDENKFRGVIERDRIIGHIIVELAKGKEES